MKKKYLTYAISNKTKQLVFVNHVPNGNECDCICPHCKQPLCAKNNGEEREGTEKVLRLRIPF